MEALQNAVCLGLGTGVETFDRLVRDSASNELISSFLEEGECSDCRKERGWLKLGSVNGRSRLKLRGPQAGKVVLRSLCRVDLDLRSSSANQTAPLAPSESKQCFQELVLCR